MSVQSTHEPEFVIEDKVDKWRFTCPEGHNDWRVWDGVFSCRTCKRNLDAGADAQSVHDHLIDQKTGEKVTRDDLQIKDPNSREVAAD
ncbi:hypothetical protein [Halorhabdus sp. CUG00001]|uniref:hypothetical protein n=1 Tax=Halorhabdus sp. CUG00001 TaxID=2600297 RepID=UPI00131E8FD7|nr:hypothetical protein [Halorhabdus sp. CUG00001]